MEIKYNPATKEYTGRKSTNLTQLAGPLVKLAKIQTESIIESITVNKEAILDYQSSINRLNAEITRKTAEIEVAKKITPELIKKDIRKQAKESPATSLIENIEVKDNYLIVITKPLTLNKGVYITQAETGNLIKLDRDMDLGKYLICINLNDLNNGRRAVQGIIALDYYYGGYHNPFITNSGFCWGNIETRIDKQLKEGSLVEAIDTLIYFILANIDNHGYILWQKLFDQRRALEYVPGALPIQTQTGLRLGKILRPLTDKQLTKYIGMLTLQQLRSIAGNNSRGLNLKMNINNELPDVDISRDFALVAYQKYYELHPFGEYNRAQMSAKIVKKHLPAIIKAGIENEINSGLR